MSFQRVEPRYLVSAGLFWALSLGAQTLTNQTLTGKYFFRQVSLGTDASGNLTDARSLSGNLTFDGSGHFTFSGQQILGTAAATTVTGNNLTYSVDPAGFVSLASPLRTGEMINARFGPEAVIGSTTESTGNTFDLFIAIPAPAGPATLTSVNGPYWAATLEFPGASTANARNTFFNFVSAGTGTLTGTGTANPPIIVSGHAANLSSGQPSTQQVTGASYSIAADGSVTVSFGTASLTQYLSGTKTVYVSKDGNILLGGSTAAGSHDFFIAVKGISGATNATWNANSWGAGLRHDSTSAIGYVGSELNAGAGTNGGPGSLIWTRRLKVLGVGNVDFTGVNSYSLNANGSGTAELAQVALGGASTGTAFIGSVISPNDAGGYEIYFGVQMPAVSGTGVWINPQGVINPTSFSPTGSPVAPGDFIRLYGSGWATTSQSATPPYPFSLNGVSLTVNSTPAAIYYVTPTTIDFLVPWSTTAPGTASITVKTASATSNTVTVPVATTAPGVLTIAQNGAGDAIMQHADYTQVTTNAPAVGGETLVIYLTGLGAVAPAVADGAGSSTTSPSTTTVQPTVLIGGHPANVLYSGLTIYPGLYQINAVMPSVPPDVTTLPLAISTPNAYHDQVDIPVQP
jgi:uncharacterized protein (TIGR03437 family)